MNRKSTNTTNILNEEEKKFEDYEQIHKELKRILARKRITTTLKEFFTI